MTFVLKCLFKNSLFPLVLLSLAVTANVNAAGLNCTATILMVSTAVSKVTVTDSVDRSRKTAFANEILYTRNLFLNGTTLDASARQFESLTAKASKSMIDELYADQNSQYTIENVRFIIAKGPFRDEDLITVSYAGKVYLQFYSKFEGIESICK